MATSKKPLFFVLDTNVILASIARKSRNRIIIDKLMNGDFDIAVTTDILLNFNKNNELCLKAFLVKKLKKKVFGIGFQKMQIKFTKKTTPIVLRIQM